MASSYSWTVAWAWCQRPESLIRTSGVASRLRTQCACRPWTEFSHTTSPSTGPRASGVVLDVPVLRPFVSSSTHQGANPASRLVGGLTMFQKMRWRERRRRWGSSSTDADSMLIGDSYTARDDLEACGVWAWSTILINFPELRIPYRDALAPLVEEEVRALVDPLAGEVEVDRAMKIVAGGVERLREL